MQAILQPVDDLIRNQAQAIVLLQSAVDLQNSITIFERLESETWLLAPGTAANTGSTGSTAVATQGTPGINCAWSRLAPNGPYADAYFYLKKGPLPQKTTFKYELSLMFPLIADASASQCIELDIQQVIGGMVYNMGLQWNFQGNQLRVWNRSGKAWVATGQPCPRWTPGKWMRAALETHRDATTVYHDALTINGTRIALGQSFPSVQLGLSDMLNVGRQMDGNQAGTAYTVCWDDMRFTAS
jgi:hypothetical protein